MADQASGSNRVVRAPRAPGIAGAWRMLAAHAQRIGPVRHAASVRRQGVHNGQWGSRLRLSSKSETHRRTDGEG
jgi:hypothetical protein